MDTQSRTGQQIIQYCYGDPNEVLKVEDATFEQAITAVTAPSKTGNIILKF
ncbi:hypothetical protein [Halomonas sp. SpR8]|uniref:hypothetical protein n=1 Tax=Halomonas sp. SpR8 TaxID=3050463 RepID=UPI0027E3C364|nr:hypothetical protein [Halomonas sp. SpR8]MDQ7727868.1 hypothetical protein [Halomonas sp. SpR8]